MTEGKVCALCYYARMRKDICGIYCTGGFENTDGTCDRFVNWQEHKRAQRKSVSAAVRRRLGIMTDKDKALMERAPEIAAALECACCGCDPTPCCEYEVLGSAAAALIKAQAAENAQLRTKLAAALEDNMASEAEREQGIEREKALREQLAEMTAERDAALFDVLHECRTCKHKPQKYGRCGMGCEADSLNIRHAERCNWEWPGAQGEV